MTSITRTGLTSPRSVRTRSILKRPASLAISSPPSPLQGLSPHVRFAASPSLTATFTMYTIGAYDRSPIIVQPNPVALPDRGDRVFSPTLGGFKPAPVRSFRTDASRFGFSTLDSMTSPLLTDFEDPRSPKVPKASGVKFAPNRPRKAKAAVSSLPRSPFPGDVGDVAQEMEAFEWSDSDGESSTHTLGIPKRNKKGLTLGATKAGKFSMSISSPHTHIDLSALGSGVTSSIKRSKKPAPLALAITPESTSPGDAALTQQFWDSISIHAPESADQPMFTALEDPTLYPEDALSYEEHHETHLRTATAPPPPPALYAGADGIPTSAMVWSPTFPRPGAAASRIRDSLMSPAIQRPSVQRRDITAPSPNDPFAAFPSFAAAFEGIRVPPRAASCD